MGCHSLSLFLSCLLCSSTIPPGATSQAMQENGAVVSVGHSGRGEQPRRGSQREESNHSNFYTCFGCGGKCLGKNHATPIPSLVRSDHSDCRKRLVRLEEKCLPPSPVPWSSTYLCPEVLIQCRFSMDSWWLFLLWEGKKPPKINFRPLWLY